LNHCHAKRVLKEKPKPVIDKKRMSPHSENGGSWIAGNLIDRVQPEYVHVVFADITPNAMHDAQTAVLLGKEQQERIAQALPTKPMNSSEHTIVTRVRPRLLK